MSYGDSKNTLLLRMATLIFGGASLAPQLPTIAGLQLHLKADAITGLADGAAVATWPDSSVEGNDATQGTAGSRPTYQTNEINGKPVVRFDGADDSLILPDAFTGLTAATRFVVIRIDTDPPAVDTRTGLMSFGPMTDGGTHFPYLDGTIYDHFASSARKNLGNPAAPLTDWHIYETLSAAGEWTAWLDGVQLFTTATNTVELTAAPTIGVSGNGTTDYFLDGDLAELLLYDGAKSAGDRLAVRTYLAAKYAITLP